MTTSNDELKEIVIKHETQMARINDKVSVIENSQIAMNENIGGMKQKLDEALNAITRIISAPQTSFKDVLSYAFYGIAILTAAVTAISTLTTYLVSADLTQVKINIESIQAEKTAQIQKFQHDRLINTLEAISKKIDPKREKEDVKP